MRRSGLIDNMNYFFDTYAIIEIVKGSESHRRFREQVILTTTLNLSEAFFILLRETNESVANETVRKLNFGFLDITSEIAIEAAKFRHLHLKLKLSYADCIGYITALKNKIKFVTGDDGFEKLDNVEFVK